MDSENSDDALNISKRKLEEDGYVNDVAAIIKRSRGGEEYLAPNLLHLSDDVLLLILRNCPPRDLKALSFSCTRLKRLCGDRSLWVWADLRRRAIGEKALAGYVRKLRPITQSLCIRGLVGRPNAIRDAKESKAEPANQKSGPSWVSHSDVEVSMHNMGGECDVFMTLKPGNCQQHSAPSTSNCETTPVKENGNSSPKPYNSPSASPKSADRSGDSVNCDGTAAKDDSVREDEEADGRSCWTMTKKIMDDVVRRCPNMKEMRLEYCNIDCLTLVPSDCPSTLEILSLKGCVCHNIPINKTYLFNLHQYMKNLVELDLSGCDWLSSHSLLQLSKVENLKKLSLRDCQGIGECVAYASLSARYGFKALEVLDIRGTLMGDSEVSSLTWISSLKELYLEPPSTEKMPAGNPGRPRTTWAISSGHWTITGRNFAEYNSHPPAAAPSAASANSESVDAAPVPAWKKKSRSYLDEDNVGLDDTNDGGCMEPWELEVPFDEANDDEFVPCPQKEDPEQDGEEGDKAGDAREGCSHTNESGSGGGTSRGNAAGGPTTQRDGNAAPGDNQGRQPTLEESYTMRINGERFDNGLVQVIYVNVRRPRADVNAVLVAPEMPLNAMNIHNIRVQVDVGHEQVDFANNRENANENAPPNRAGANIQVENLQVGNNDNAEVLDLGLPLNEQRHEDQGMMHHIFINRQRHVMQEGRLVPEQRELNQYGQIRRIYMNNLADLVRQNANEQPEVPADRQNVDPPRPEHDYINFNRARANYLNRAEILARIQRNVVSPPLPEAGERRPVPPQVPMFRREDLNDENMPTFRNLRHLDNSVLVTDDTLRRFAAVDIPCMNRATGLRVLVCRGYSGITDRGLLIMANVRTALRVLDVSGTRVTAEARATFRRLRPECKLIHEDDSDSDD